MSNFPVFTVILGNYCYLSSLLVRIEVIMVKNKARILCIDNHYEQQSVKKTFRNLQDEFEVIHCDDRAKIKNIVINNDNDIDISAWKRTADALRQSENRYQTLTEISPVGIFRTDAEGSTTYVNPRWCKIAGFTSSEALGYGWLTAVHPADRKRLLRGWKRATSGNNITASEYRFVHADGTITWVIGNAVPEKNADNQIIAYVGTITDITENKQAEEEIKKLNETLEQRVTERTAQLEAANKELDAFSYSTSHDLRSPLRSINGFTHILMEDYAPALDDEGKRICGVIRDKSLMMGQLIDDLLAFSRLSRTDVQQTAVCMQTMVNSVYNEITEAPARERIDFTIHKISDTWGDPSLLKQVWTNLISNAIKYSSKRKRASISVSCRKENQDCIYSITDNGVGFNMKYVGKLFCVFQRLHSPKDFDGTGVGLAIVQRIVLRHGGKAWAESEVNKGATFYFSLPLKGNWPN